MWPVPSTWISLSGVDPCAGPHRQPQHVAGADIVGGDRRRVAERSGKAETRRQAAGLGHTFVDRDQERLAQIDLGTGEQLGLGRAGARQAARGGEHQGEQRDQAA